ncbi:MAG: hypothetical protein O3C63_00890 [Cyanobacteria bacterium]|nr:hypothetical protein [Cyanobacteriota bacterium]MDA1021483.1 hypothetical protein [Cyanobacteriota bacterium]
MTSLICAACVSELPKNPLNLPNLRGKEPILEVVGIGYLEAAINLSKLLQSRNDISEIIFVGTAGAYSQNIKIGEQIIVSAAALLNLGSVQGLSYTIKDIYPILHASQPDSKNLLCLSSLEITQDETISKQIIKHYQTDAIIENMELYGIAKVASDHQIPWSAHLRVTNYTNKNAHEDYISNIKDGDPGYLHF